MRARIAINISVMMIRNIQPTNLFMRMKATMIAIIAKM